MAEPPKRRIITGLDISRLTNVRPTKIPSASVINKLRKRKINYRRLSIDAGILALIILICYGTSLMGGFVFNDHFIDKFLAIKISEESFWSNLVIQAISTPLSQPWITASFVFNLQNFGFDASWYHITNIILHFLSCFYFYILIYRLASHFWHTDDQGDQSAHDLALSAAGLFACHPLACESVGHISGCSATIVACNILLAVNFFLWGFLSEKTNTMVRAYILTIVFFLFSIFSDGQALILPAIMFLLILLLKPGENKISDWLKTRWSDALFVAFLGLFALYTTTKGFTANFSNGFALPIQPWTIYVASQFRSLVVYYLRCFVLPIGLSVYPPFVNASGLTDFLAILGLLLVLTVFYLIYKLKEKPLVAFALGLALFGYLPQIFFVQNEIAADRRFYLSIAGLTLLIALALKKWLFDWRTSKKVKALAILLILVPSVITIVRTLDFRSDIALLKAALRVNHGDPSTAGMLALELVNARKPGQGIVMAKDALKIDDNCQPAHLALGRAYLPNKKIIDIQKPQDIADALDMYRLAKGELEKAYVLAKSQHLGLQQIFLTQVSLAEAAIELNEYQRAKEVAKEALMINPNSVLLNLVMGKSLNALGKYLDAFTYLNKVYERDKTNPDCIEPLAEAALGVGTPSTINIAYNVAKLGIKVKNNHQLSLLMARAAFETGHYRESFRWIDRAYSESPHDAKAIYLRSYLLQAIGDLVNAKQVRAQSLKLEPDLKDKMPIVIVNRKNDSVMKFEKLYDLMLAKRKK